MEWNCGFGCGPTERDGMAVIVIVNACPEHGHLDLSKPSGVGVASDLVCGACGSTTGVTYRGWHDEGAAMPTCARCGPPDGDPTTDSGLVRRALAFARVAIRSGEAYTDQAKETIDAGFSALAELEGLAGIERELIRIGSFLRDAAAPPTPDTAERFESWAYLELFGHRTIVGFVQEDEIAGRRVLGVRRLKRVVRPRGVGEPDPPLELEEKWVCYAPSAIFSFEHLADEAEARARWTQTYAGGGRLYVEPEDEGDIPF